MSSVHRAEEEGLNVLVRGSSRLIGSAFISALANEGHRVIRLARAGSAGDHGTVRWDPSASEIDIDRLEGIDAVVHLAGESVEGRWTSAKKARIRKSRVQGTRLLAETLAGLPVPPGVMVSASATGYYGDRGDELLREESAPGPNFLARTCQEWEPAADPARGAGVRVAHPRFGLVLSAEGGALAMMLPIFKLGGGRKIGSGRLRYFLYFKTTTLDSRSNASFSSKLSGYIFLPIVRTLFGVLVYVEHHGSRY